MKRSQIDISSTEYPTLRGQTHPIKMNRHHKTKREKCACRYIPDCKLGESNPVGQNVAGSAQSARFGENGTAAEHDLKLDAQVYPTACQVPVSRDGDVEPLGDGGLALQGVRLLSIYYTLTYTDPNKQVVRVLQDEFGLNSRQLKDLFGGYDLSGIKRYLEEPEGSMYARSHLAQSEKEDTRSYISGLTFYRPPSLVTSGAQATETSKTTHSIEPVAGSYKYSTTDREARRF